MTLKQMQAKKIRDRMKLLAMKDKKKAQRMASFIPEGAKLTFVPRGVDGNGNPLCLHPGIIGSSPIPSPKFSEVRLSFRGKLANRTV